MYDTNQIKKLQDQQNAIDAKELNQLKSDIRLVFGGAEGSRVLVWLLDKCGIFSITFTSKEGIYFNEGRRSIGLEIIELIRDTDINLYLKAIRETTKDE